MRFFISKSLLCILVLTSGLNDRIFSQTCLVPYLNTSPYPGGVIFNYGCNPGPCNGTFYIEYGLSGFTPGTDGSPGAGGTLLAMTPGILQDTLNGLAPSTSYDAYIRQNCGTIWGLNSPPVSFITQPDCNTSQIINCNTFYTTPYDSGFGTWSSYCSPVISSSLGKEIVYRFTATDTGMHYIFVEDYFTETNNVGVFYYKETSLGCNDTGWTCIGFPFTGGFHHEQMPFGPLVPGTEYYIRFDNYNYNLSPVVTQFRIECPDCGYPDGDSVVAISPYTAAVYFTGGDVAIEYGPHNFLPGTGVSPGDSGTISFHTGSPVYFNGQSPLTEVDFYIRNKCGNQTSVNSYPGHLLVPSCPVETSYQFGQWHGFACDGKGYNWMYGTGGCFYDLPGTEKIFRFTPPYDGYYDAMVSYPNAYYGHNYQFLTKTSDGNCLPNGFDCPAVISTSGTKFRYSLGPLSADSVYDFFLDISDTLCSGGLSDISLRLTCPSPDSIMINFTGATSVEISWTSHCDTVYLEYGPANFTPGSGSTPGPGGTLIPYITNPVPITGLTSNGKYDVYLRSKYGNAFSENSNRKRINMSVNCYLAPLISCGSVVNPTGSIPHTIAFDSISWNSYTCLPQEYEGSEKVFSFIAPTDGLHYLYITQGGWFCWNTAYFYKDATTGSCDENSWSCIDSNLCPNEFIPFGPLQAGHTYNLLMDGPCCGGVSGFRKYINLFCPAPCFPPISSVPTTLTDTSVRINMSLLDSTGVFILEYGPPGFTPGIDSLPGTGGTVVSGLSNPDTIYGLSPATTYHYYIRQQCQNGSGYSENKFGIFQTYASQCAIGPVSIASNADTVCQGNYSWLQPVGVYPSTLNPNHQVIWYTDSCFSTPYDTGNGFTVVLQNTTTFFAIVQDSCGFTNCVSKTITVLPNPQVTISSAGGYLCEGDSMLLDAGPGYAQYLWSTGATTQSIYANLPGWNYYTITVTSANGCTSEDDQVVMIYTNPQPVIIGDTVHCQTVSGTLNAGSGYFGYLWNTGDTIQTITISQPGTYHVTVTGTAGCTLTDSVVVTINPLAPPLITGDTLICASDTVNLDAGGGYAGYSWSTGNNSQVIQVFQPGTYSVVVSDFNGCTSTNSITIVQVPIPVITLSASGPLGICQGDSVQLAATPGMNSYQWLKNNIMIPGATAANFYASGTGNFKCNAVDSNGCEGVSNTLRVRITCIPIGPNHEKSNLSVPETPFELSVTPNPSSGGFVFTISCNDVETFEIELHDQSGRKISAHVTAHNQHSYFIGKLPAGLYFATAKCGTQRKVVKLVQLE